MFFNVYFFVVIIYVWIEYKFEVFRFCGCKIIFELFLIIELMFCSVSDN